MMMEINAPQLRYLAGLTDRDGYLGEAISGYPVMQRLEDAWTPGSLALSSSNVALAYAPDPANIHYANAVETYVRPPKAFLDAYEYDFLIFPVEQQASFGPRLAPEGDFEVIYEDDAFVLAERSSRRAQ